MPDHGTVASRATDSASNARGAIRVSSARPAASRANGAKSRGPRTAGGKAHASQNALKHGLRAQRWLVLWDENEPEFKAFAGALRAELAPEGALQATLVTHLAAAAWRMRRADRMEAELLSRQRGLEGDLGVALIRDGSGPRAIDTLLRYRGAAAAEFSRALRTLKTLQGEARAPEPSAASQAASEPAPVLIFESRRARERAAPSLAFDVSQDEPDREPSLPRNPNEPESPAAPDPSGPACRAGRSESAASAARADATGSQTPSRTDSFPPRPADGGRPGPESLRPGDPEWPSESGGLPCPPGCQRGKPGGFGPVGSEAGVADGQLFGRLAERGANERCAAEPCGRGGQASRAEP
jgi:hypothetical protein